MALFAYCNRGELPEGDPAVSMAFSFIRAAMDENAARWEQTRAARSEAGRAGGLAKAGKASPGRSAPGKSGLSVSESVSETVSASGSPPETPPPLPPEKEPKVHWADHVAMTEEQHEKLLAAYGPDDAARLIEILDNYKGSTGKSYRDDYRAILSWCVKRLREETGETGPRRGGGGGPAPHRRGPDDGMKADLDWLDRFAAQTVSGP